MKEVVTPNRQERGRLEVLNKVERGELTGRGATGVVDGIAPAACAGSWRSIGATGLGPGARESWSDSWNARGTGTCGHSGPVHVRRIGHRVGWPAVFDQSVA